MKFYSYLMSLVIAIRIIVFLEIFLITVWLLVLLQKFSEKVFRGAGQTMLKVFVNVTNYILNIPMSERNK